MLEVDWNDDHVVGGDVIRDQAEIAVGWNERQNFLVFPSAKRTF